MSLLVYILDASICMGVQPSNAALLKQGCVFHTTFTHFHDIISY